MKNIFRLVFFICIMVTLNSCNSSSKQAKDDSSLKEITTEANKVKSDLDFALSGLKEQQKAIMESLDSINSLADNVNLKKNINSKSFKALENNMGKKLSILEKFSHLQSLEQDFNNVYDEITNTKTDVKIQSTRLQKLKELSKLLIDSSLLTLKGINTNVK